MSCRCSWGPSVQRRRSAAAGSGSGRVGERVRRIAPVAGPPLAAAVLGNGLVGRDALQWFTGLRRPAKQVPLPGFVGTLALVPAVLALQQRATGDPWAPASAGAYTAWVLPTTCRGPTASGASTGGEAREVPLASRVPGRVRPVCGS